MKPSELLLNAKAYLTTSDQVRARRHASISMDMEAYAAYLIDNGWLRRTDYICTAIDRAAADYYRSHGRIKNEPSVRALGASLQQRVLNHIGGRITFKSWWRDQPEGVAALAAGILDEAAQDARHKWVDDTIKELQEQGQ